MGGPELVDSSTESSDNELAMNLPNATSCSVITCMAKLAPRIQVPDPGDIRASVRCNEPVFISKLYILGRGITKR